MLVSSYSPGLATDAQHVRAVRQLVLEYAHRHNVASDVLMAACAEIVATTGATIELQADRPARGTTDGRLKAFTALVRTREPHIVAELVARRRAGG